MRKWTAAIIVALAAVPVAATEAAAAGQPAPGTSPETGGEGERFYAADVPPPIVRKEAERLHVARPTFGAGYVPYPYPGFDTCPCDEDGCYHPGWYYCGGSAYRQTWCRRWVRAHLGHGSMLEAYPCHCVLPTFGRPYGLTAAGIAPVDSEAHPAEAPEAPRPSP
jgi:hypothetical protein